MAAENLNLVWAGALIDELVRGGVTDVVVCPGSRSAPLAVAAARHGHVRVWPVLDERAGAFIALGMARARARPAAVVCTSGTAGAHLFPAVLEAAASGVPLVVLTADRPWELHGFGAPQTWDQERLFGTHVRRFESLAPPDPTEGAIRHLRAVVGRAASERAGPVHLNVAFREPLAPTRDDVPAERLEALASLAPGPRFVRQPAPAGRAVDELTAILLRARRPLLVCGPQGLSGNEGTAMRELAEAIGAPVFAEASSGARFGGGPGARLVVGTYDLFLRTPMVADALRPDVVLRFGGALTSKTLQGWLDASGADVSCVAGGGRFVDPHHRASLCLDAAPGELCSLVAERLRPKGSRVDGDWRARVLRLEHQVRAALGRAFDLSELCEPAVARTVVASLRPGAALVVSSSMPIREVDAFVPEAPPDCEVLANRGLNGIDGLVATAAGVSAAVSRPTMLLTGDVAFAHDLGGWSAAARLRCQLGVVVVNNGGGGIFDFLPIGRFPEYLESLFTLPPRIDLASAAAMVGAHHSRVSRADELGGAVRLAQEGGLHLIEAVVDRSHHVARHRELQERIARIIEQEGDR